MAKGLRISLPGNPVAKELEEGRAFLLLKTSALPPEVDVQGVAVDAWPPKDKADTRVRDTVCPECRGHRFVRHRERAALIECPACHGTARVQGLVAAVSVSPIEGDMQQAHEFVRLFGGVEGVRIYPHLLLRPSAPIKGRNGITHVWVDPDGRLLRTVDYPRLGRVVTGDMVLGFRIHRHGPDGDGTVEVVSALQGRVLRELVCSFDFTIEPARGVTVSGYAAPDTEEKLDVWGVDLPTAFASAFAMAFAE